ncbi:transposase [Streptomyces cinereoruber]|uniref:transposase n=1 Tax=Streptomyces cinereoruber TaxID=67260 RepID=UPI0036547771
MLGVSDRQAAEAVRCRIDFKYAMAMELDDPGFHHSVSADFRGRLAEDDRSDHLLDPASPAESLRTVPVCNAGLRRCREVYGLRAITLPCEALMDAITDRKSAGFLRVRPLQHIHCPLPRRRI